jgi:hypothetical protein
MDFFDYKVEAQLNQKPTINDLSAPNWTWGNACDNDEALYSKLSWQYSDGGAKGTAYELVVDTSDPGTGDPPIFLNRDFQTGTCLVSGGVTLDCNINIGVGENSLCLDDGGYCHYNLDKTVWPAFDYDKNYYWWVRVWDDLGEPSEWKQYNTNTAGDTDGDPDGDSETFTTYLHEFPQPYFTWSPAQPAIYEEALFISRKKSLFGNGAGIKCTVDDCGYLWEHSGGATDCDIDPADASSTIIIVKEEIENLKIDLTVTDKVSGGDYYCSTSTLFNVQNKLPMWIEAR